MIKDVFVILPLILILLISNTAFSKTIEKKIGYNLSKPDAIVTLPSILHEISGLTNIDSNTFACIQDENGLLFIYDAVKNTLKEEYVFHIDGDYEGIAKVDNTIYVLRSDGILFEIIDYTSVNFRLNSYMTGVPANNNEGLCFDKTNNRLLIACKGKIGKGPQFKDTRVIYGFDLKSKRLSEFPVFEFDLPTLKQFAIENNIILPVKTKKKDKNAEPIFKMRTSAIAINPISQKLFLLSASDHILFVFNRKGEVELIEYLNPELFNKAEGITFFNNGDMLITNEGQDKKPTLLRFNYK